MIKDSVLLRRTLSVVVISLLSMAILITLLYNSISQEMFTEVKFSELKPKAYAFSELVAKCMKEDEEAYRLRQMIGEIDQAMLGADFALLNMKGEIILTSDSENMGYVYGFTQFVEPVLRGEEVTTVGETMFSQVMIVGVGVPVMLDGVQVGGIVLFLPMYEALAALASLERVLLLVMLIVIPLGALVVALFMGRVVQPLRQMRDVARNMASGNYTVRADANQKGEVGQLAESLNHLARELSRTIGDLTLERNRLRQSLDGLSEGFISVNSIGKVTHHNPAVSALFNCEYISQEIEREKLLLYECVWTDFDEAIKENRIVLRDIDVGGRLIRCNISPFAGENGEVAGAVGLFSDITESERLERTRRDYVANVSHELRTPLTAMRALIEPLRDGMIRSEEARVRYYDIILREVMRLSRLIDDLMELSRLQSGKISIDKEIVPLDDLIVDLAEKYSAAAEDKGRHFNLMFDPTTCPRVFSNADRVEQVLVILLDNAMKYTPEGGEIFLNVRWNENHVVLSVRDTGIGISEEDLPYVFDRFYKVDKSRTGSNGSGLGLSIAREMLKWMGEEIFVTSEKGKGSEFSFTLKRYGEEEAFAGDQTLEHL